jgi:AraC-like DNA-binding protein
MLLMTSPRPDDIVAKEATTAGRAVAAHAVTTAVAHSLSEFRVAVNESFVPLRVTSPRPEQFRGMIRGASVDEVHLTDLRATGHMVERTPELIARGDRAYFKVSVMLAGSCLLIQDNRETVLSPGDLAVYDTSRPYSLVFDEDFRSTILMFPQSLITLPPEMVGQLTAVRIPGAKGLGAIATGYLTQVVANLDRFSGTTGARLGNTALDLIATVLTHELGLDETGSDPHRTLLRQIHDYIDHHLASTDLDPNTIAAAHFISTRHLHGLFQEEGTTVSTWIRMRRLERCRRDLVDPALADRSVAAVAARWGFVDAAHFSRAFKAAFDQSPSEFRAAH